MFDINLLANPGLQGTAAELQVDEAAAHEKAILERLQARAISETPPVMPSSTKAKSKLWTWLIIILVILVVASYWWYQGWSWKRWREIFPFPETPAAVAIPQVAAQPSGSCAVVMARFLGDLPFQATIDFMDAGAGIFTYRIQGEGLNQSLLQLNTGIEGRQFSDLITPSGAAIPDIWLGTVAFTSRDQVGALLPVESEYEHFFNRLRDKVRSSGGVIVETVPGTMTAGEYVLQGSLDEIRAHLVTATGNSTNVHYHRMSLLKRDELTASSYLLRVIFNLIEERSLSPQLLSPGGTGA